LEVLAYVALKGNVDTLRDLIAAGIIVSNKPVKVGSLVMTALGNASVRGDLEMIRTLINAGINDPTAKTAGLVLAARTGKIDAMRLLIQSGANPVDPSVLVAASASGIPSVVQEILSHNPDVNARDRDGIFAILACLQVHHGRYPIVKLREVVRLLLDAGADPNLGDRDGYTPLIANSQDSKIAQMLIAHGANVNARTKLGVTPLINSDTAELTRLLLQHGADPFAKDYRGNTALDWAIDADQKALLEAAMAGKRE
jgi:ankyrin repeat protein